MTLVNVYSRSPISHQFSVVEDGIEKVQVIEGMNRITLETFNKDIPKMTQIDDALFCKIKEKYKDHITLFGGKTLDGVIQEPQIYLAKTEIDAKKKMDDSKPIITEREIATKTKGIEKLKEVG